MRKLSLTIGLILATVIIQAQSSLLYEISKPGSSHKSYLFGTIHTQDARAFTFNDSVFWAIDQSNKCLFELALDQGSMVGLREDIKGFFTDSSYVKKVKNYVQNSFMPKLMSEIPAEQMANKLTTQVLPAYFSMLENVMKHEQRLSFVDLLLQNYAKKQDKNVIGIETVKEQIHAFVGDFKSRDLDSMQLDKKFIKFMKQDEIDMSIMNSVMSPDVLIELYGKGNLKEIGAFMENPEMSKKYEKFYTRLLINRNDIMAERTKDLLAQNASFIAVGAGHLIGKNGLINQYKSMGYTLRPVNLKSKTEYNNTWTTQETASFQVDLPQTVKLSFEDASEINPFMFMMPGSDSTIHSKTLYTPKGQATFNVTYKNLVNEESYDSDSYLDEYGSDEPEEPDDAGDAIDATGTNEEASDVVDAVTDAVEAAEEEIREYEEEEMADDEIVEIEYDYSEEEQEEYQYTPYKKPQLLEDSAQNAYLKQVGDSLKGYMMMKSMKMMKSLGGLGATKDSTWKVNAQGKEIEVKYSSSMLGTNLSRVLENGDMIYTLKMTGDKSMILTEEYLRFFTSFKLK